MSSLLPGDVAAHFAVAPHQKAHSVCGQSRRLRLSVRSNARRDRRMRLSVRSNAQNALFRRMRFSSPGQTSSRLTEKRTLCRRLTEKRTLDGRRDGKAHSAAAPHQKAHSVCGQSRRLRLSVRSNAQNALFRRMRFSSPGQTRRHLMEKRTLDGRRDGKPHSAAAPHQKVHSVCGQSRRMRFSVRVRSQNALFRRMRFSSPGQTRRHLTEKRILCRRLTEKRTLDGRRDGKPHSVPAPHEKAHFGPRPQIAPHGKTALCVLCMLCAASHRVSDLSLG